MNKSIKYIIITAMLLPGVANACYYVGDSWEQMELCNRMRAAEHDALQQQRQLQHQQQQHQRQLQRAQSRRSQNIYDSASGSESERGGMFSPDFQNHVLGSDW